MAKPQKKNQTLIIKTRSPNKPAKKNIAAIGKNLRKSSDPTKADSIAKAHAISAHSSKQATLIALMRRVEGATIDDLTSATGWQKHSVRGALSGALKKRLGLAIVSGIEKRGRIYRITGERR